MRYSRAEKGNDMDNLTREMQLCEKAGFGVSYGKWKATQPIKEAPKKESARTCLYCGRPITSGTRRYCNNDCSTEAWKKRKASKDRYTSQKRPPAYALDCGYYGEPVEKNCEWCGKSFMAKRKNHRYCQNSCSALASYYRRKAEDEAKKAGHD